MGRDDDRVEGDARRPPDDVLLTMDVTVSSTACHVLYRTIL